ncbi:MAG: hypothetical protein K8R56_05445 [Candidatus Eisenbacteria bacterium]|nr:hypothetical protein [Candidatus Eisenbacteria bacterium]
MTALLVAGLASLAPDLAAGATAPAASSFAAEPGSPFEVVERVEPPQRSHRLFWTLGLGGAALVAASFPMARSADRRYDDYLSETDPSQLEARFQATRRMDRLASASLWTGEAMLVTAVWLRFVRTHRPADRVSLTVEPARCAVSFRF